MDDQVTNFNKIGPDLLIPASFIMPFIFNPLSAALNH